MVFKFFSVNFDWKSVAERKNSFEMPFFVCAERKFTFSFFFCLSSHLLMSLHISGGCSELAGNKIYFLSPSLDYCCQRSFLLFF